LPYLTRLIWPLVWVGLFSLLCTALGGRLLRRSPIAADNPALRLPVHFALGSLVLSYAMTLLGQVHLLSLATILALLIAAGLVGATEAVRWRPALPHRRATYLFALMTLLPLAPAILLAIGPPVLRDTLVYHLALPKQYLAAGGLVTPATNFFAAFPKAQEMLFTIHLAIAGETAAQLFTLVQHVLACLGIYGLVAPRHQPLTAALAAAAYAVVPASAYFAGVAYVEPALALTLVATLAAIDTRRAVLAGLFAGYLVALKYTGLVYLGAFGLWWIFLQRDRPPRAAVSAVLWFSIAAMPGLFWLVHNVLVLGNPVFPFAYGLFGGPEWDLLRAHHYAEYLARYGFGHGPLDVLLLPFRMAFSGAFDSMKLDGVLGAASLFVQALAIGAVALRWKNRGAWLPGLGAVTLAFALFFVLGTQQARFYLPAHLLLCVFAAPALAWLVERGHRTSIVLTTIALVLALLGAWQVGEQVSKHFPPGKTPLTATRDEILAHNVAGYAAYRFIGENLPPDAKVFAVATGNYGYLCERETVSDSFLEDHTLFALIDGASRTASLRDWLLERGFTHLLINLAPIANNWGDEAQNNLRDSLPVTGRVVFREESVLLLEVAD
jgi:hypothetical protein